MVLILKMGKRIMIDLEKIGKRIASLCRTYFDREIFEALERENDQSREDRWMVYEDHQGYLFSDF